MKILGICILFIGLASLLFIPTVAAKDKSTPATKPSAILKTAEKSLSIKDLPAVARETLKQEAKGETFTKITSKTVDGKLVYVGKADIDGKKVTLQVDEKGKLISKKTAEPKETPKTDKTAKTVKNAEKTAKKVQ